MLDLERVCENIVKLLEQSDTSCIKLSQALSKILRGDVSDLYLDLIARTLYRSGRVKIYFSSRECDYYVCKRDEGRECEKLTMQKIVDLLRSRFDGDLIPKPHIVDFLKELVPDRYDQIYNVLVRDGVLEEVNISGMMFVKIVR